jgi:hypothetical protein
MDQQQQAQQSEFQQYQTNPYLRYFYPYYDYNPKYQNHYAYTSYESLRLTSPSINQNEESFSFLNNTQDSGYYTSFYATSISPNIYNEEFVNAVSSNIQTGVQKNQDELLNDSIQYETPHIKERAVKTKPKRTVAVKNQLPDYAVDIMNDWFDDHVNNPYPTLEQKEKIAQQGGITLKQVNAWFSNRRNRSQNTKPKRIKREFEKEIESLVNEISNENTLSNNKDMIIQKLQQTLYTSGSL